MQFGKRAEDRAKTSTIKSILHQALKHARSIEATRSVQAVNRTPSPKPNRSSQDPSYSIPSVASTPETYRKPEKVFRSSSAKSLQASNAKDKQEIDSIRQDMDSYIKSSSQAVAFSLAETCLGKVKGLLQEEVVKIEKEMQDELENVLVGSVSNLYVKLRDNTLKWIDSVLKEKGIEAPPTRLDKNVPKFNLKQRKPMRRDTEVTLPNIQLELDKLPNTKNLYLSKELPTASQLTSSLLRHLDKHLDNATLKVETLCTNFIQKTVQDKITKLKDFIIRDMQEHIDSLTTQLNRHIELLVRERMVEVVEALRSSEEPVSPSSPDGILTEEQKIQNLREMMPLSAGSLISRLESKKASKSQECPSPPMSPGRCKNMPRRPAIPGPASKNATKV